MTRKISEKGKENIARSCSIFSRMIFAAALVACVSLMHSYTTSKAHEEFLDLKLLKRVAEMPGAAEELMMSPEVYSRCTAWLRTHQEEVGRRLVYWWPTQSSAARLALSQVEGRIRDLEAP